jgi:hypothetical protein
VSITQHLRRGAGKQKSRVIGMTMIGGRKSKRIILLIAAYPANFFGIEA